MKKSPRRTATPKSSDTPPVTPEALDGLRQGARCFDRGEYYQAHEAWEQIWLAEKRPLRGFYQGLVHYTAAYHHQYVKRHSHGVAVQFASAVAKLQAYAPVFLGVDVAVILADALRRRDLDDDAPRPRFPWARPA